MFMRLHVAEISARLSNGGTVEDISKPDRSEDIVELARSIHHETPTLGSRCRFEKRE